MDNPFKAAVDPLADDSGATPDGSPDLETQLQDIGTRLAKETAQPPKSRRGGARPGAGRKPKNAQGAGIGASAGDTATGNKKGSRSNVAAAFEVEPPPAPTIDKRLVEECVSALLTTIDGAIKEAVGSAAIRLTDSKPTTENLVGRVALRPGEKDLMAKLTAICSEQYGLAGQHAPLLLLGITSIVYGGRVFLVMRTLRTIAELKARTERKEGSEQFRGPAAG